MPIGELHPIKSVVASLFTCSAGETSLIMMHHESYDSGLLRIQSLITKAMLAR